VRFLSSAAELGDHADVVELEAAEAVKAEKIAVQVQAAEAEREAKAAAARPVTADTLAGFPGTAESRMVTGSPWVERRGWDSNPRNGSAPSSGFQDRPFRPLGHPAQEISLVALQAMHACF
jgi:hypothetical protein